MLADSVLPGSTNSPVTPEIAPTTDLDQLIAGALNLQDNSLEARTRYADQAGALMANMPDGLSRQVILLAVARAYIEYENGAWSTALAQVEPLVGKVSQQLHPTAYVRLHSVWSTLHLLTGSVEMGLQGITALMESDLSEADPLVIEYARLNYALALIRNGRAVEGIEMYRRSTQAGINTGVDRLALGAGTNLVIVLNEQRLYQEAKEWLTQLEPIMQRRPHLLATQSLKVNKFRLLLHYSEFNQAIAEIEAFVANPVVPTSFMMGEAYSALAQARRELGKFEQSLDAGRQAVTFLSPESAEYASANVQIALTLLEQNKLVEAEKLLGTVQEKTLSNPDTIADLRKARLQIALANSGMARESALLDDFLVASENLERLLDSSQSSYYEARRTVDQQQIEIALINEQKARLSAEAISVDAKAQELELRTSATRKEQSLLIALGILAMLALVILTYLNGNRRVERQRRVHEQGENENLSRLVDEKSRELIERVTEQSRLEQALMEHRHMESIGQMTSQLAHDFNNLLQVVSGTNEILAESITGLPDAQELSALLDGSNTSLQTGSATISQLLAYSRRQRFEEETVSLTDFFTATRSLLRSAAGEENQLSVEETTDGGQIRLDTSQLTAALLNLIKNATDAMPVPGLLRIRTGRTRAVSGERLITIEVIDQGTGMTAEQASRALEPFYTSKDANSGTGLGLPSVQGFVRQSGGTLSINSVFGKGTTVTLHLPEAADEPLAAVTRNAATHSLEGANVLLVEDNDLVASSLVRLLHKLGASCVRAESSDAALAILHSDPTGSRPPTAQSGGSFDYLLTDLRIPGRYNGQQLAQKVSREFSSIKPLLMSGHPESGIEVAADLPDTADHPQADDLIVVSEDNVIQKPFTTGKLLEFVARANAA